MLFVLFGAVICQYCMDDMAYTYVDNGKFVIC